MSADIRAPIHSQGQPWLFFFLTSNQNIPAQYLQLATDAEAATLP
jgi:hypothetical protein